MTRFKLSMQNKLCIGYPFRFKFSPMLSTIWMDQQENIHSLLCKDFMAYLNPN